MSVSVFQAAHNRLYRDEGFIWIADDVLYGTPEAWRSMRNQTPPYRGDCSHGDELVIGRSGPVAVRDLKDGDEVLSYDFEAQAYVYRTIKNFRSMGVQPVFRVRFKNAQEIRITEKSPMFARAAGESGYQKKYLNDIVDRGLKHERIPCALSLDVEAVDNPSITEEMCFLLGHYLAEGWIERGGSKVSTSGRDIPEHIEPILKRCGIPYSIYENNSGVPCVRYLESPFKTFLKDKLVNSFEIRLGADVLLLPLNKIQSIVDGYFLGDGHYKTVNRKRSDQKIYTTSCQRFAADLSFMLNRLGTPAYPYKQENHQGVGKKPIWRVEVKSGSRFAKERGFSGMSDVEIGSVTPDGEAEVFDFEVEGTHGFFYYNGIYGHNCEDAALTIIEWALEAGCPRESLAVARVATELCPPGVPFDHAVAVYLDGAKITHVSDNRYPRRLITTGDLRHYRFYDLVTLDNLRDKTPARRLNRG